MELHIEERERWIGVALGAYALGLQGFLTVFLQILQYRTSRSEPNSIFKWLSNGKRKTKCSFYSFPCY